MPTYPPLTPEQRRQLIEAPIRIRTIGGSRHGGTGVASDDGVYRIYPMRHRRLNDDESFHPLVEDDADGQ